MGFESLTGSPNKTHLIFREILARGAERRVRWQRVFLDSPVVESGVRAEDFLERGFFGGEVPKTLTIMSVYARASGYPALKSFGHYETSGDAEGWLASIGIPTIAVELRTHETIEWAENLAGIMALFEHYSTID